jgi:serine/threonine protein kinase
MTTSPLVEKKESAVRSISLQEIEIGSMLGSGAYSTVYRVRCFPKNQDKRSLWRKEGSASTILSCDEDSEDDNGSGCMPVAFEEYFAMKKLRRRTLACPQTKEMAVEDLAHEAAILSKIPYHPNIVTLHAVSPNFSSPENSFLVLGYLSETLHDRLEQWRSARLRLFAPRLLTKQQQLSRIEKIGLPIARAMAFLHRRNICYRDLKSQNCGFGLNGQLRLFDFGFARELKEDENRGLTTLAGTPRYMAPEVMRCEPYSTPSDMYSSSILLWELVTLQKPYAKSKSFDALCDQVAGRHIRPCLKRVQVKQLKTILTDGWHRDPKLRPSFEQCVCQLQMACNASR